MEVVDRTIARLGALAAALDVAKLRAAALDAIAVLAPTDCSGCGAPDRALCSSCVAALRADVLAVDVVPAATLPVPSLLQVHCALRYAGVARRVLLAVKELGRTDAAPALSHAAGSALAAALAAIPERSIRDSTRAGVQIATIPSTRAAYRTRGYHPTELILAHAGIRASHPLRAARQTADQAGLGMAERSTNRAGSLIVRRKLRGEQFILFDDIVTTGATLLEARRAIHAAGGRVVGAAAIANTVLLKAPR